MDEGCGCFLFMVGIAVLIVAVAFVLKMLQIDAAGIVNAMMR